MNKPPIDTSWKTLLIWILISIILWALVLWGAPMFDDCYTVTECKARWRMFAKKYHPDSGENGNAEMFNQAKEAYDRRLRQVLAPTKCSVCNGKGKVPKKNGFNVVMMICHYCGGQGKIFPRGAQ